MPEKRARLGAARRAAGLTQEDLAHRVGVDRSTVGRWEAGNTDPQPWARCKLAAMLGVTPARLDGLLERGGPRCDDPSGSAPVLDDEIEAMEFARRATSSDVGEATVAQLERGVDELAVSYSTSRPADLLDRTRRRVRYVGQLLEGRTTLNQHRRLLVVGGWLSLLAATLHIDLKQHGPAVARLGTADSLAREAGHDEIRAWCAETDAWRLLTVGEYLQAAQMSRVAQEIAPRGTSALIQATAQEGRAMARLGDARSTRHAVHRVNRMAGPLATPDQAEHHYRYDPSKATSYTATTLSWVGDPTAATVAREVVNTLSAEAKIGRPRRLAVARLDLALALIPQGHIGEAAQSALEAMTSGRVAPSNRWRALEVVRKVRATGAGEAVPLAEAYRELTRSP